MLYTFLGRLRSLVKMLALNPEWSMPITKKNVKDGQESIRINYKLNENIQKTQK